MTVPVLLVLKSGGEYTSEHVYRLAKQIRDLDVIVYTDQDIPGVECRYLESGWPGWWSKLEIFRHETPFLYLDLDSTVMKPLQPLVRAAQKHNFVAMRDVYRGKQDKRALQSSIMYSDGTHGWLLEKFKENPRFLSGGDQIFIQTYLKDVTYWQDITNEVSSYKVPTNPDPTVWIYHGKPRPWEVE